MFEIVDKDLAGRIGKIYTKSGVVETPALFPVVNPIKQTVDLEEIKKVGFNQIITNAYLIYRNYGDICIDTGIHNLLNWNGIVMTDSGAYQLMEYGEVEIDPDTVLKYQVDIGSDIGVILDIPTRAEVDRDVVFLEVEETLRRARRAIMLRDEYDPEHRMLLVGPVQGGEHVDIVAYCARKLSKLDFDIYAIGSVTLYLEQYNYTKIVETIIAAKLNLPQNRPIHLFGAGHPMIIPIAVALGVDMFDSASYILYARDDRIMLHDRTVRLEDIKIENIPCTCPICTKYSVKELREMSKNEREKLIAIHNLYILKREIDEVKQRIREGTLWEYLQEKSMSDARLRQALILISKISRKLLKISPTTRGDVHGIDIQCMLDISRPQYTQHIYKLCRRYVPPKSKEILLILPEPNERPFNRSSIFVKLCNKLEKLGILDKVHICFLSKIFGIIPHEISDIYPLAQFEYVKNLKCLQNLEIVSIYNYLKTHGSNYRTIILVLPRDEAFKICRIVKKLLNNCKVVIYSVGREESWTSYIDSICSMVFLHVSSALPQ